jgi:hypothetical protein
MSEFRLSFPACVIAGKSRLSAEDLTTPRGATFPDEVLMSKDAVTLPPLQTSDALQSSQPEKCEEWNAFFVEAISEFVVHQSDIKGQRLILSAAEITKLGEIRAVIDPASNDTEWNERLARLELREDTPKTSRWLRVSDDIFASDGVAV